MLDNTRRDHFANVISSEINHLATGAENRKTAELDDDKIIPFPDPRSAGHTAPSLLVNLLMAITCRTVMGIPS